MITAVSPQPLPSMTPRHWAIIGVGLAIGVGVAFEVLYATAKSTKLPRSRVYTLKHFWLLLSGVIHVSSIT
jgi:hypothetical protein